MSSVMPLNLSTDFALNMILESLDTTLDFVDGEPVKNGAFTLDEVLEWLSEPAEYEDITDDMHMSFRSKQRYDEHSLIRALINEIKELKK